MILPTRRLLICYAVTIPAVTLLPVLGVAALGSVVATGLMLTLVALLDAACARARSSGISVSLPASARATRKREMSLGLTVRKSGTKAVAVRVGLLLPPEIASSRDDLFLIVPQGTDPVGCTWPLTPLERGRFHIDTCYLETGSLLGLWAFRSHRDVACEIRVYPNLTRERESLAALFLNRGGFGIHPRRQQGKGREFERLRDYIPGDGYDEIHWKATARRRHPITKVFQIERTQEVYVAIDASRLSARPVGPSKDLTDVGEAGVPKVADPQLERFIAAALVLGLAAQKQGDLFGLLTFSDSVHDFLRAGAGKAHYSACREHIFGLRPRMVNPDYEELCTFIRLKLRRRALILMLTSLDDPALAESFTRSTEMICRHHLVMVNMFRPANARPLFANPETASTDEIYDELSGHVLWHNLLELQGALAVHGVRFALLDHEALCANLVSEYMNVKQRQLL